MGEKDKSSVLGDDRSAWDTGSMKTAPAPAMQFKAEPPAGKKSDGGKKYLKELTGDASSAEIMVTEEFKALMAPDLIWQSSYDLSYEQAIRVCELIIAKMQAGEKVNWYAEAEKFVRRGMRAAGPEESALDESMEFPEELNLVLEQFQRNASGAETVEALQALVATAGDQLWENGKSLARPGVEGADTALYWARIKMRNLIRTHSLFSENENLKSLNQVYEVLEKHSRGMHDITWDSEVPGAKRILVTGFDPFGGGESNPSGILAERMDGMTIPCGDGTFAVIEGVTFPVRYNDFDKGMVEKFAGPLLNDAEQNISMVMTISLDGSARYLHLDRFAAKSRGGSKDNSGISSEGNKAVLPQFGGDGAPFIESNFPIREMLNDKDLSGNVALNQGVNYSEKEDSGDSGGGYNLVTGKEYQKYEKGKTEDPLEEAPGKDVSAISGPGGDYLSNEIYYRMSQLTRKVDGREIPNIHLHIPPSSGKKPGLFGHWKIDGILDDAISTIAVAAKNHGKED